MFQMHFYAVIFALVGLMSSNAFADSDGAPLDPENYNPTIFEPPELPTKIHMGVFLVKMISIEPASSENPKMQAQFKIRLQWIDRRVLALMPDKNKENAFQDDEATTRLTKMFNPRIEIVDGESKIDHQHLRVFPNGAIVLSQVVTVTVPANMQLLHFPFDSQIFQFQFASTYWEAEQVDLFLKTVESGLGEGAAPTSWHFDYSSYHVAKSSVRAHSESFYSFTFLVHAQRDPWYFIWRLLLPLVVIVILSWNVFWMYEDSASALGNCFVFLLTVVAFHQIANEMLPMIPFFTFMDSIVFVSYGFIIIPTFQVMVTTKLENLGRPEDAESIRRYCRWLVPVAFVLTILSFTLLYFAQS